MRHVLSLVTGIVVAPIVWLLVAAGQGASRDDVPNGWLIGGGLLVGVGLLAGLIGSLRTSPAGAIFASVVFLGASSFMYVQPDRARDLFETAWRFREYPIDLATPLTSGVLAFAGGLLLMSLFSAARWRGRPSEDDQDTWNPIPSQPYETQYGAQGPVDNWSYR